MIVRISILFILLGCFSTCEKGFEELQVNPNGPTSVNPDFLFTESVARAFEDDRIGITTHIWGLMVWTQMAADIAGVAQEGQEYNYGGTPNDDAWSRFYVSVLAHAEEVIKITEGNEFLINKNAVARIWRAYNFQRITDLWGPVPYSEALKATDPENPISRPVYDDQKSIYLDLLAQLKEAELMMDEDKPTFEGADPLFQGDIDAWTRFARSLRLRIAVRMSGVEPDIASAEILELLTDETLLISNNTQSATFPHIEGTSSPLHQLFESGQGFRRPSNYLIKKLVETSDPRVRILAEITTSSTVLGTPPFVGTPNLLSTDQMNSEGFSEFNTSALGPWYSQATTPGLAMSYAEVCFLKAESALNGWGAAGTAEEYYNSGVEAAMTELGLPEDSASTWLSLNAFNGTLAEIIEQKWISLSFRDGFEAFAELR
ncbi:MAG: hypothetical protein ACI959_001870, partial [Limisphaerales bacterium]